MRTSSVMSLFLLLFATLFAHVPLSSGEVSITWEGQDFDVGRVNLTNNGNETLEVTYQWAGTYGVDDKPTSGKETITLSPGEVYGYGGHGVSVKTASIISTRVDRSGQINKQIDDLEGEIARLDSDPKTRDIEAKISTAESIRNRIRDDRDLTAQDRSFLLSKIQAKIDKLENLSLDKKSKKAAMLSQLQSLRAQLSN